MSSSKRLLITINTSWNIVNFRRTLIERFKQEGYEVHAAAPEDAHTETLKELVDGFHPLAMQNDGTSFVQDAKLFWRYFVLLRKLRPSAVLAYTVKPNIYATLAARLLGIRIINNVSGLGTVFIEQSWVTRVVQGLYRIAFASSTHVFFQNHDDQALFVARKLVQSSKSSVLPGSGIDLDNYAPVVSTTSTDGAVRFVLIARLLWDKGVGEYVQAAIQLKARDTNAIFRLVGPLGIANKTAVAPEQVARWQEEGAIEYLGESSDVRTIIASHDCVVLPSYREGMSRVLLEAAAMGKPLIASDVPGCREVVQHGRNGFLCAVRDSAALADAMQTFIDLSAEQKQIMGQQSRALAEATFDETIVHEAYLAQLQSDSD